MKRGLIYAALTALLAIGLSDSLAAQTTSSSQLGEKFKSGIIDMAKEMIAISKTVKTVADAKKAEPKIEKMMGRLTAVLVEMSAQIDNMTPEEATGLTTFESLVEDPEVAEWGEKAEAAIDALRQKNAEAAEELEIITRAQSEEFMGVMMEVMQKIQEKIMSGVEGEEFYQEEGEGY